MKALIVGEGTGALAAVRELGRAGWFVGVAASGRRGWAGASRWAARRHPLPDPAADLDGFVESLARAIAAEGYEVVFPATDTELLALSAVRDRLAAAFPYAPHGSVLAGVDKLHLADLAREAGFEAPLTRAASPGALDEVGLPCAVKPRLHWRPDGPKHQPRIEAAVAATPEEALRLAEVIRRAGGAPVFQRFVPGTLVAYVAFADARHRIAGAQFRVTLHARSSETGPIALAESAPVPGGIAAPAQALLERLQWTGLATLQFQRTEAGALHLIDFNGRLDGEYALTGASGMTAMDTWARLATGRATAPPRWTIATGPRYQAILADLRYALAQPAGRVSAALAALRDATRAVHPIWQSDDPGPAVRYVVGRLGRWPENARK